MNIVSTSGAMRTLTAVGNRPEVAALDARIKAADERVHHLDQVLAMKPDERIQAEQEVFDKCRQMALKGTRTRAMVVGVAGLGLGTAAAAATMGIPGVSHQVGGLIALGTLAMTFVPAVATRVSPMALYAWAARKWFIPHKAARLMDRDLRVQLEQSRQELETATTQRTTLVHQLVKQTAAELPDLTDVKVDDDFVELNGIQVAKNIHS